MIDKSQLPFLLKLMSDQSPQVRAKVAQGLRAFGPRLRDEIESAGLSLTEDQESFLELLQAGEEIAFRKAWLRRLSLEDDTEKLEATLELLAAWQSGEGRPVRLRELLNDLAEEFIAAGRARDPEELSTFLFLDKGLQGPEPEDYYNPLNSNLVYVLQSGYGIPISLVSIFILVGKRVGLEIYGCNFPDHFLARARLQGHDLIFDCFNGGRLLPREEIAALRKAAPEEMRTPASATMMIARVLRNLANAYYQSGEIERTRFMLSLLGELEQAERQ
jgi:regulator of sirC expression with transglutaminase-like and TPR domain